MPATIPLPDANPLPADKDNRSRLIDAALEVLLRDGILGFSQSKVARQAGLRQSHLTYYFPTRNDLLTVVVEHGCQLVINAQGCAGSAAESSLESFRQQMCDKVCDSRIARLMVAVTVAAETDPKLKSWLSDFDRRMLNNKREAFLQYGITCSHDELALFHSTIAGIALCNLNSCTPEDHAEARHRFLLAFDRLILGSHPIQRSE
ncbi:TetR/AcrR family transcriptional regulator [Aquitalea magnusonii]|jgi:AcrR family transcriptional regulator|uniref:TetR/AcrR family transcriptional regulator n=1 Tax=Aquitalea magnusonii TaxID=332411 RepID=UPI000B5CAE50|nr:TetR family transcriptional regulator [Aquitalea magnusonii]